MILKYISPSNIKALIFHKEFLNFINYYVFTIIGALIGVVTVSYLTKHILPEDYGMIGVYTSIIFFVPSIISFSANGLQSIEIVNLDKDTYLTYRNSHISFVLLSSVFYFIIACIIASFIQEYSFVIMMAMLMGAALSLSSIHNTELIQYSKPTSFGLMKTGTTLLVFLLSLLFISVFKLDWKSRILAILISEIIMLVLRFFLFSKIGANYKFSFDKKQFKAILHYGTPLMLAIFMGWLLNQADRYFLLSYYSLKEVGLYAAGAGVAAFITTINANMIKVVGPLIYKKLSKKQGKKFILKLNLLYSIFILIVVFVFCLILNLFGDLFLGEKYLVALPIIYIMCFAQAFFGIYTTTGLVIDYFKRTRMKTILVSVCTLSVVVFSFLLIPLLGVYGPAVASLISFFLLSILSLYITTQLFYKFNIA